jgi:Sec-independent protein translocase protein TatA
MTLTVKLAAVCIALSMLAGCGDRSLHLKVHFRDTAGLGVGSPVVEGAATLGAVEFVEADPHGGYLIGVTIKPEFSAAATADARFFIDDRPPSLGGKQVTVERSAASGPALAEGATVEGSERAVGLAPFGELFRQFGEGLKGLRGQLEQFQEELRKAPASEEAKRIAEEWRRLTEEVQKAQSQAEESVKKDLMPKLQQEMDRLKEQFRRYEGDPTPKSGQSRPL